MYSELNSLLPSAATHQVHRVLEQQTWSQRRSQTSQTLEAETIFLAEAVPTCEFYYQRWNLQWIVCWKSWQSEIKHCTADAPETTFTGARAGVICLSSSPSHPLDNIRVMAIVWGLRGNIIRTAPCWAVWHNVHSRQHTYMSSSYRSSRLGLSHWDPA